MKLIHLTTVDLSLEFLLGPQLRAFRDAGYEVVGASASGPWSEKLEADGIRHLPVEAFTRAFDLRSDVGALRELVGVLRRERPDIVHTHTPKAGVFGRLAARRAGVPAVVNTQHGLYAQPGDRLARRVAVLSLERIAAAASHLELFQNPDDLETMAGLKVPRRRLRFLGNGVDLERFDPDRVGRDRRNAVRAGWGVGPDDVVFGAVGRLVAEKGYAELFEAMGSVRAVHPNARLVVVGPSDEDKGDALSGDLLAAARASGVILAGFTDRVEEWYPAMDCFVLASHREGFPRAAMEAAAMGLGLIVTDIRGCRLVVDHDRNGLLVPVRDPRELADALSAAVTDPERRRRWGAASVVKARSEFDQRQVIRITLDAYRDLGFAPPNPPSWLEG